MPKRPINWENYGNLLKKRYDEGVNFDSDIKRTSNSSSRNTRVD